MKTQWEVVNTDNAEYVGIIEFQSNDEEWHDFEIVKTETYLVFGGFTNTGLLQSGHMMIDHSFSIDENLQELIADLEIYYNDGYEYTTGIICNDRM